jgi:anti-sigma B factor antagonist
VDVSTRSAQCIITVSGDVDIEVSERLGTAGVAAVEAADSSCELIVVDLTDVTFIDSSGLAALVAISNAATTRGSAVRLRGVPPQTAKILKITGLDETFTIE